MHLTTLKRTLRIGLSLGSTLLLLVLPAALPSAGVAAYAGEGDGHPDARSPSQNDPGDFQTLLAAEVERSKVTLITESTPLRAELPPEERQKLLVSLNREGDGALDLQGRVGALAAAFDYEPHEVKPRLFVFAKRYSQSNDLPFVTLSQCSRSLQSIGRALSAFHGRGDEAQVLGEWTRSLNEGERERLAKGVRIGDLSPAQRSLAWQLALQGAYNSPLEDVIAVGRRLKACERGDARFLMKEYFGIPALAYAGPFGPRREEWEVVLSQYVKTSPGGGTFFAPPGHRTGTAGARVENGRFVGDLRDPTDPPGDASVRVGGEAETPGAAGMPQTVQEVVRRLNSEQAELVYETDSEIAPTPLSVFGPMHSSHEDVFAAVAELYGLRVVASGRVRRMTLPVPRVLSDGRDIAGEVRRLLPASFVRAMRGAAKARQEEKARRRTEQTGTAGHEADLYVASVRRLRGAVEAQCRAADRAIAFADVNAAARDLVGLSSLASCGFQFQTLLKPVPAYISNFEDARITLVSVPSGREAKVTYKIESLGERGQGGGVEATVGVTPQKP